MLVLLLVLMGCGAGSSTAPVFEVVGDGGIVPATVRLRGGEGASSRLTWTFPDGTEVREPEATHTFTEVGAHCVQVTSGGATWGVEVAVGDLELPAAAGVWVLGEDGLVSLGDPVERLDVVMYRELKGRIWDPLREPVRWHALGVPEDHVRIEPEARIVVTGVGTVRLSMLRRFSDRERTSHVARLEAGAVPIPDSHAWRLGLGLPVTVWERDGYFVLTSDQLVPGLWAIANGEQEWVFEVVEAAGRPLEWRKGRPCTVEP